jgi:hypothetical protein
VEILLQVGQFILATATKQRDLEGLAAVSRPHRDGGYRRCRSGLQRPSEVEAATERCIAAASNNPHRAPGGSEAKRIDASAPARDESAALAAELGGAPADGKVRPTKPTKGEA